MNAEEAAKLTLQARISSLEESLSCEQLDTLNDCFAEIELRASAGKQSACFKKQNEHFHRNILSILILKGFKAESKMEEDGNILISIFWI